MPKLISLLACEKVILSTEGPISLVNVFSAMNVPVIAPIPDKALAPNQWAISAIWRLEPSEAPANYTHLISVVGPDGELYAESRNEIEFVGTETDQMKTYTRVNGMPISVPGVLTITAELEGIADSRGYFYFRINHTDQPTDDLGAPEVLNTPAA